MIYDPASIRDLEATLKGFEQTNTYFVSQSGTDLYLSGHGFWDLGAYWMIPKIADFLNCSVELAVSFFFAGLILSTLFLTAVGTFFYFKSGVHKLIHFGISTLLLALLVFQNQSIEQISFFWIISSFPLYLWIHRSRKLFLPTLFLMPLSLLGCLCFLVSWKFGGGFYILSILLLLFSEQRFLQKIVYCFILFVPLFYGLFLTKQSLEKAIVRIEQVQRVEVKPAQMQPIWHDLLKGLGQYENDIGLEKQDRGVYEYVSRQGQSHKFMSDSYLKFVKSHFLFLTQSEAGFLTKTYIKKGWDIIGFIITGKIGQWMVAKVTLILFLIWGMIGLIKYLVVQRDYKVTLPFIFLFFLFGTWPFLTAINISTCTPMIALMYCYFTTMGIWDWERTSGDHFPFF